MTTAAESYSNASDMLRDNVPPHKLHARAGQGSAAINTTTRIFFIEMTPFRAACGAAVVLLRRKRRMLLLHRRHRLQFQQLARVVKPFLVAGPLLLAERSRGRRVALNRVAQDRLADDRRVVALLSEQAQDLIAI